MLAQILGIIGMTFNILSYQFKSSKQIILMQFIGAAFFVVNFYLLSAIAGALLNIFVLLRGILLVKIKRPPSWLTAILLATIYIIYALTFLVFGVDPSARNVIVESLPVIAQTVQTFAFSYCKVKTVRYLSYVISPLWLTYNCFCFSIGGIICECFALVSNTIGIIRYRKRKAE